MMISQPVRAKVETKIAPPDITPTMIDDGFNADQDTYEEVGYSGLGGIVDRNNGLYAFAGSKNLGITTDTNGVTSTANLAQYAIGTNSELYYQKPNSTDWTGITNSLGVGAGCDLYDNGYSLIDNPNTTSFKNHGIFASLTGGNTNTQKKFYRIKDKTTGKVLGIKQMAYAPSVAGLLANTPLNSLLCEELVTPNSDGSFDTQLFVKNVSDARRSFGILNYRTWSLDFDDWPRAISLGSQQGFRIERQSSRCLFVNFDVHDGPTRYMLVKGKNYYMDSSHHSFIDAVGLEAQNYQLGDTISWFNKPLGGWDGSWNYQLLWPWQTVAPNQTVHYDVNLKLVALGYPNLQFKQSYTNTRGSGSNYPGDKLNVTMNAWDAGTGGNKLWGHDFTITLPKGLKLTTSDLQQVQAKFAYSINDPNSPDGHSIVKYGWTLCDGQTNHPSLSYDANSRQLKISPPSDESFAFDYNDFTLKYPVTVANDALNGNLLISTTYNGYDSNKGKSFTASSPALQIPIAKTTYEPKLTTKVKNLTRNQVGSYATSAMYVPGDQLGYEAKYTVDPDTSFSVNSLTFQNSPNANLRFPAQTSTVTVKHRDGSPVDASATLNPSTGAITVTRNGGFQAGDVIDLTYKAKTNADAVAGQAGAKYESVKDSLANTVKVQASLSGDIRPPAVSSPLAISSSTNVYRQTFDYFVSVPTLIDFGKQANVAAGPFSNQTTGQLKVSHYVAATDSNMPYHVDVQYTGALHDSGLHFLQPDITKALIYYRSGGAGAFAPISSSPAPLNAAGFTTKGISDLTDAVGNGHFQLHHDYSGQPLGQFSGTVTWTLNNSL
ncbi:hypothetical protein MOO45_01645 [Bombilactobacillus folatiphilus]|uniref:Cell surface protein n=1 Tax=Bombilactobacillus folatiphilus TaxID=2923362 RepID=A0ABY4P9X7_9LACO|nr:hypothetical protein [Bombilactobacillus folatiphilus]UQS82417.1 hypothetical protein MOO45_01645 [Bombilactobacillus folatiphilus]